MKKRLIYSLYFFIFLIFGCDNSPNAPTDWEKMKLNGNIKSMKITTIFNPEENKSDKLEDFHFNKLGYIEYIEKTEFLDNDELKVDIETFSYDNKYFLINKHIYYDTPFYNQTKDNYEDIRIDVTYDSNKKEIERRTTYEKYSDQTYISKFTIYDENEKIMKEEFFNSKNEMTKVIAYLDTFGYTNIEQKYWNGEKSIKDINSFNSKGNLTEKIITYFYPTGNSIYRETYNYDNKDNLIESNTYMYESPYLQINKTVYEYKYDDFDNWIQVIEREVYLSEKFISAKNREITYYDE